MAVKKISKPVEKSGQKKPSSNKPSCGGDFSAVQMNMIRECAYYIWERKGRPSNTSDFDFQEAVQELKSKGLL